ncbi:uncharacterized protein LOC124416782 [Diprion similis]|uniref:uncharacterized protein LOC124416782 n=1 Tax=Diprion similis TaxID=362088 RepID=UPI001EF75A40|nr:uncharacterized protein LOC124416782 [Diprion similis]
MINKSKHGYEEGKPLLVLSLDSENLRLYQPECETAVTKGAANYLGRWPGHVFAAFVSGFLVITTFVLLGIVTAMFTITPNEKCRISRNSEVDEVPNVYFIKHENRTWNTRELCYIENTARTHENLSVYLINLSSGKEIEENLSEPLNQLRQMIAGRNPRVTSKSVKNILSRYIIEPRVTKGSLGDKKMREKLTSSLSNVKNIEVPIGRFFNGSRLANVCNHLSKEMLEMAARAYMLWNFPGVALDPAFSPNLDSLKEYLCRDDGGRNTCAAKDSVAAIELNGDVQAASVPCQAFIGDLIRQIAAKGSPDQRRVMQKAINNFCPRSSRCLGVKILNPLDALTSSMENLNCPTILSKIEGTETKTVKETLAATSNRSRVPITPGKNRMQRLRQLFPWYLSLRDTFGPDWNGFDIIRIMNSKPPLRCANRQRGGGDVVPTDIERDLKLMTSILGIEHYTLIMLGAITEYPMLHTPWLLMQLCVILVEVIVFFVRLFLDGLHVKRDEILLAFLAVHNWLQVFCLFHRQARHPTF